MSDHPTSLPVPAPRGGRRLNLRGGAFVAVLVLASMTLAAWAWYAGTERAEVLVVARAVPLGAVIEESDLETALVSADAGIATLDVSERDRVVGRYAATSLSEGMLLAEAHLTDAPLVDPGQQQISIALAAELLPAESLQPGWVVDIVDVSDEQAAVIGGQEDTEALSPPRTWEALVVDTVEYSTTAATTVTVYLAVDEGEAAVIVALAAAEEVALTLKGQAE